MKQTAYRAVICDLDGTLLDTLEDIAVGTNHVLSRAGFPTHPVAAYRHFVGNGVEMLLRQAVPPEISSRLKVDDPEALRIVHGLIKDLAAFHKTNEGDLTRPYPEIPALLTALAGRGIKLGVLSNKPHPRVTNSVPQFFPGIPFFRLQGATPDFPLKPDPAAVLAMTAAEGLRPEETIYLGDSDVDMRTARNAGMFAAGAGWGFRGEAELLEAGAERVFKHPLELLELF